MLDKEVKTILQEQFSKERNYQRIINNANKKEISFIKILKYALLPTCAIILTAIIIPNINKENNKDKEIAQINIIKVEENNKNTIVEKDNNEIIEENKTQVEKDNNLNKDNNKQIEVAKGKIYKTIQGGETSWAYDPTIPENLIKDRKEYKYIVKVKVTSVGEGEMLSKQENFYNPFTCHTPIKMQIIDNLSDANKLSGTITAYITGGKIKISNILENATKQEIEYMGIYDVSQVDKEKYIEYLWSDPYYEPTVGNEYIMILSRANENLYQICCGGYGIFKVEKSNNQVRYINVVTNKEWKIN